MISFFSGIIVTAAGGAGLWHFMPTNGQVHRLALIPVLDSVIPVAIVSALGAGIALIVSGLV